MAAAIEDGLVTPDTVIEGIGHEVAVGGTTYSDVDDHPYTMTVAEILEHSSNVGTIRIAGMLGPERFDHYLHAFGVGQRTSLGFPGEADYPLLPLENYNDTSMGSMPVGNGIAVTAMQMLDVYVTIANDGHGASAPPRVGDDRRRRRAARQAAAAAAPGRVAADRVRDAPACSSSSSQTAPARARR